MDDIDLLVFARLFKDAYAKCFGYAIKNPLSETESKIFCNKVLDQTGLSIGWKSVKNYSFFIIDTASVKQENPSVATLDTLARYVVGAPYSTEIQRKNDGSHYPYWFLYREKFQKSLKKSIPKKRLLKAGIALAGTAVIVLLLIYFKFIAAEPAQFTDDFRHTDETSMFSDGWFVKSKDAVYWAKRSEKPGILTLYTLKGDNWPDPSEKQGIKNLLLRKIPSDCFIINMREASSFAATTSMCRLGISGQY